MHYTLAIFALAAAVHAKPVALPQAVTAIISPSGAVPSGCSIAVSGSFGIAVQNVSTSAAPAKRQVTQASDGQPLANTVSKTVSVAPITQISDAQPQAATSQPSVVTMAPVSMITDGQIQGGFHTMMMMPIEQIGDGQVQDITTVAPVTVISDGQPQAPKITVAPVSQISDAQPQAPTSTKVTTSAVSELSEGQPQAPTSTSTSTPVATTTAASELSEGQPQAPTSASTSASTSTTPVASTTPTTSTTLVSSTSSSTTSSAAVASSTGGITMVACASNDTLALTLEGGILKDSHGRTGYIASNYQLQFDNPPQHGAIYTAGFSICSNSSLSLGGSAVFYQCLSGSFYNLYNENWAKQCSPVTINTLTLQTCA
ncbi:Mucin-21 [Toensbergia leucococca]|nr:Mucin-21 [Toensbergia leucococca]